MKPWEVLEERCVYKKPPWLVVREQRLRLPNGREIPDYILADTPAVSMIFALTEKNEVVLVEQYRHGVGGPRLDLPAGHVDEGEAPETAAPRELEEETGYRGGDWTSLGGFYHNINRNNRQFHFYLAQNVVATGTQKFDITEDIRVHLIPLTEIRACLHNGRIQGLHSMAGIYHALDAIE